MIDVNVEMPLSLREAAKLPALRRNGRKPHLASIYRWVTQGVRGQTLETVVIGGSRCTTAEAVMRWIDALTHPEQHRPAPPSSVRRRQQEAAVAELVNAGFEVGGPDRAGV